MHIPGPTLVESWIDHPNITAVLAPLLPGEQTGPSLVSILSGQISPSGALPFTIAKSVSDYPPNTIFAKTQNETLDPQTYFTEGNLIDYKWFDQHNIEPRFAFGYGLSYSTFEYSNIRIGGGFEFDKHAIQKTNEKFAGQKDGESLYDVLATVEVDVKNTGSVVACEVAQLVSPLFLAYESFNSFRPSDSTSSSPPLPTRPLDSCEGSTRSSKLLLGRLRPFPSRKR